VSFLTISQMLKDTDYLREKIIQQFKETQPYGWAQDSMKKISLSITHHKTYQ
jgi:hypothetical protein